MLNHVQHSTLDDISFSPSLDAVQSTKRRSHSHRRHSHKRKSRKCRDFHEHQCAVCLEEEDVSQLDTKLFPCGHIFHGECLIQWAHAQRRGKRGKFNCPLCRQDIAHFIQMTGNQTINDQLIRIWNEHNLFNASTSSLQSLMSDDDKEKFAKFVEMENQREFGEMESSETRTEAMDSLSLTTTSEEIKDEEGHDVDQLLLMEEVSESKEEGHDTESGVVFMVNTNNTGTDMVEVKKGENRRQSNSMWDFLWNSPLSLLSKRKNLIAPISVLPHLESELSDVIDQDLVLSHGVSGRDFPFFANQHWHQSGSNSTTPTRSSKSAPQSVSTKVTKPMQPNANNSDDATLWKTTPIHFKAGLWAGLCAGSTTYLLNTSGRSLFTPFALRGALIPILSETVPSVAVFFTSYEHCKRYLFAVDNIENSHSLTFCQRFISAGIASSFGAMLFGKGMAAKGLLPFRFATFFGTFEFCKDAMNVQHERLNLFEVASAATIGGTVSHGLYYPLLQRMDGVSMEIAYSASSTSTSAMSTGMTRQVAVRMLYKGWVSSLSKFLPSCVVCSCAFEYGKRYLSQ